MGTEIFDFSRVDDYHLYHVKTKSYELTYLYVHVKFPNNSLRLLNASDRVEQLSR
jgi:hypothetical protein